MNKLYFGDNLEILREEMGVSTNTLVRLPDAWRIRPTHKSARHFSDQQMQLLRG